MACVALCQLPAGAAANAAPVPAGTRGFEGLSRRRVALGGGAKVARSLKDAAGERRVGAGRNGGRKAVVVCAVGDVASDATGYLVAGAIAIAVVGTAFPLFFSRKDTCPVCGGAGFVRGQASGGALRANVARKDQQQIVCKNCNGLGKVGQTDKSSGGFQSRRKM